MSELVPLAPGVLAGDGPFVPGRAVQLAGARCSACGRHEFPARERCPACRAPMDPVAFATSATVAGFTAVNHPPPGALVEAPYAIAVGAFAVEGVSVLGVVTGASHDELAIGDPVETVVIDVGGAAGYGFRPVAEPRRAASPGQPRS